MTLNDLKNLTFQTIQNFEETRGVAKNKGKSYRKAEYKALDDAGAERRYKVMVSSDNIVKIEDFGKTREQMDKEVQAGYDALKPQTKLAIEAMDLGLDWLGNKTNVGEVMEGKVVRKMLLLTTLGNRKPKEKLLSLYPNVKSLDDAIAALQDFYKNFCHFNPENK